MRRRALRDFIRAVALSALPLTACAPEYSSPCSIYDGHFFFVVDGDFADGGTLEEYLDSVCCTPDNTHCVVTPADAGAGVYRCEYAHPEGCGRRPRGLARAAVIEASSIVGDYLARAAHLEMASVTAFERLAAELAAHHAPHRLIDAATRAAADEVRHAAAIGRLAAMHGASVAPVEVAPFVVRELSEIGVENSIEGCVNETFGALVATWQARIARDEEVRRAMGPISEEETAHAELSWTIAEWIDERLSGTERRLQRAARRDALAKLQRRVNRPVDPRLVEKLGIPNDAVASQFAASLMLLA